jgi:hypothetical protein
LLKQPDKQKLASRVKALGYEVRDEHDKRGNVTGWQIEGVPQAVCAEFSRRRRDIEAGIEVFRAKYGRYPSTAEIGVITRETGARSSTRAILRPPKKSAPYSAPDYSQNSFPR